MPSPSPDSRVPRHNQVTQPAGIASPAPSGVSPILLEMGIKTGVACTLCLLISLTLHLPLEAVGVFKVLLMMTLFRSHGWQPFAERLVVYSFTALLFVTLCYLLAGKPSLLLFAIVLVSAPYLYIAFCGVTAMPTVMGGPIVLVPLLQALYDPSGAIEFSLYYFGQMLLALIVSFWITHLWGSPEAFPNWRRRPEPTRPWPLDRRQALRAARATVAVMATVFVLVVFEPPGTLMVAITALILSAQPDATSVGRKTADRFLGCLLGTGLGFLASTLLHMLPQTSLMVLIVFVVMTALGYLTNMEGNRWYVWLQAGIAFSIVTITSGPGAADDLGWVRVQAVLIGAAVAFSVYLLPWRDLDRP